MKSGAGGVAKRDGSRPEAGQKEGSGKGTERRMGNVMEEGKQHGTHRMRLRESERNPAAGLAQLSARRAPRVAIVIVVWNGIDDTLECLRSLAADPCIGKFLILVDNGSVDGSAEKVRLAWPGVHLVKLKSNLGFTGGNNAGIRRALELGAEYVFLLNNDTTVEPAALGELLKVAESEPAGAIFAPVTHYYDSPGEIWFSGARLRLCRGEAVHDFRVKPEVKSRPYTSPWVTGCAMLVRVSAVEHVGVFDDRFFLSWEDVDWCIRMRGAGWGIWVVPASRIFHKCSRATQRLDPVRFYYAVRNSLLLAKKHAGIGYWSALLCVVTGHARSALRSGAGERADSLRSIWDGLRDHWLGRYGCRPPSKRAAGCPAGT